MYHMHDIPGIQALIAKNKSILILQSITSTHVISFCKYEATLWAVSSYVPRFLFVSGSQQCKHEFDVTVSQCTTV